MVDMNGVEQGLVVQNLLLATQAMGLGGFPFSGGKGRVTMGGTEHWQAIGGQGEAEGLGFTFHEVPADAPVGAGERVPVGLAGVFEADVPPFHAEHGRRRRRGRRAPLGPVGRLLEPRGAGGGTVEDLGTPRAMPRPSEWAIAATKAMCSYIWETYGHFPATLDPMLMTAWYQAHHLDVAFYDLHYPPEALPEHVRTHMARWHSL